MARAVLNGLAVAGAATVVGKADTAQLAVQAHSTQTANLQEWRNSGGTAIALVDSSGTFVSANNLVASSSVLTAALLATASGAGVVPVIIKGAVGQSAYLQEWQNSGGTPLAFITAAGMVDAATAGLRTKHESSSIPTGGSSGEVRVGTGKVWVQDAGTWKSVAVSAAGAPTFAERTKWGTD